jgi:hypothetical protein
MRKALLAVGIVGVLSLGAGSAVAASRVAGDNAASTMHDRMSSTGTGSMMRSADMNRLHDAMSTGDMDAMHAQMRDAMPVELRAACDAAHASMNTATADATGSSTPMFDHAAHHGR